ncbi:MAG: cytochrome b N-terminal domain-containing protein [Nitrospinota bacterium]
MKNKLLSYVSEKIHWRHFFGGLSFILIILQLIIGIFLIFFYEPSLSDAYKSVQHLTNNVTGGSLLRNLHRWIAFSLFLSIIIHTIRCILRLDFFSQAKRILWLTGVISLLPLFLLIITGVILPWEWKGYWFMEIIPNYSEFVPFIGSELKTFFINTFTLPRYEVIHILLLPMTLLILVDYHFLNRLRKRGVFQYIFRHTIISLPILVVLLVLSKYITIPTEDPQVVPLPLEGGYIPAAE